VPILGDIVRMTLMGPTHNSICIQSSHEAVEKTCNKLLAEVASFDFSENDTFAVHLSLEEALLNAAKHGNKLAPDKSVSLEYSITPDKFEIFVTDQGEGFDPKKLPDPRIQENLYKYGGRGVLLMESYMDLVEYDQGGTRVHMIKYRSNK